MQVKDIIKLIDLVKNMDEEVTIKVDGEDVFACELTLYHGEDLVLEFKT